MFPDYINLFLDWANNFLTVERFAEHYSLTDIEANHIIDKGRALNQKACLNRIEVIHVC